MEAEEQQLTAEEEGGGGRAVRALRRRLPCLRWGARYSRLAAVADLVAGLTLGLTLVPQSIAYAALADLPVQYGLYSAFVGTVVYMFFGTVKEVSIGPTSLMALMTLQICRGLPIEFVVLLTFLSGILVMLMGLLKLGFLVELISPSVTSGFTSGTAIIIVVSQLKGLLGLSFVAESVPENLGLIAHSLDQVRLPDLALSAVCCTALLLLRKVKDLPVSPKRAFLRKTLWLISIARNALVVCIASTVAYCLHDPEKPLFKLSGRVEAGLPPLSLPSFSVTMENRTLGFLEMAERLTPGLYMMPVIMVLANIAIAKAFTSGGRVDATQEMLTLGLCNMLGALVHAMPTCGAFTRSAVSHSSGVRTPAAGLYSGILTLLALNYMTQYFYFIPKACLSSVLICAVIFMIDVQRVARLWRTARGEAAVTAATCAAAAASSAPTALVAGALASLAALLAAALRAPAPPRTHQVEGVEVLVVEAPPVLAYINAETFAARLHKLGVRGKCPLLLDCSSVAVIDHSARQVLERVMAKLRSLGAPLLVFGLSGAALRAARGLPGTRVAALRARGAAAALRAYAAPSDPADPTDPADPADPTDPAHLHNSKEMETLLQNGNV